MSYLLRRPLVVCQRVGRRHWIGRVLVLVVVGVIARGMVMTSMGEPPENIDLILSSSDMTAPHGDGTSHPMEAGLPPQRDPWQSLPCRCPID